MVKKVKVSFCPRCRSTNVGYTFGLGNLFGIIPKMRCSKCGYTNVSFPILVVDKNKLGKKNGSRMNANKRGAWRENGNS
ncbi:MAG: hypothetical protein V1889_02165 [archaeon]